MTHSLRSVLLVDKSHSQRELLAAMIRKEIGCVVLQEENPDAVLRILETEPVDVLVLGLSPREGGLDLLRKSRKANSQAVVIAGVPLGQREDIVEVLKQGAFSYINLPYDLDEAVITTARGLYYFDLLIHHEKRGSKIRKSDGFQGIIGKSSVMRQLFDMIGKIAADPEGTVLIQGESGTGKELVARAIHTLSERRESNFVPVNCAAIPEELLESELFGHAKGAFTGAARTKMGRIQYADGGTLFLDEIGDMKPSLQSKLLRVLQEREFEPVGEVKPISINLRVIAATHQNLEEAVEKGRFREDLYYRLSVIPITIPPLRDRREDIALLIEKFLQVFNRSRKTPFMGFSPDAMNVLSNFPWPGNVRELENLIQRMTILNGDRIVEVTDLPEKYRSGNSSDRLPQSSHSLAEEMISISGPVDFNTLVEDFENRLILQALQLTGGNKKEAARFLNLNRTTLLEKIKKKGLQFQE